MDDWEKIEDGKAMSVGSREEETPRSITGDTHERLSSDSDSCQGEMSTGSGAWKV